MPKVMFERAGRTVRRVSRLSLMAAALALSACTGPAAEQLPATGETDEVLQGHSQWCGMNPPSGYCDVDDNR